MKYSEFVRWAETGPLWRMGALMAVNFALCGLVVFGIAGLVAIVCDFVGIE